MTPLEPKFPVALIGLTGRLATVQGLAQEMNLSGADALNFLARLEEKSGVHIPLIEAGGYGWFHLFSVDRALRCLCPSLTPDEIDTYAQAYKGMKREHIQQMLRDIFQDLSPAKAPKRKVPGPTQHGRPILHGGSPAG